MKIYADVRCLQDKDYSFRGVGYHSSVLLRNCRRYFSRDCELIGLIDTRLPDLPACYAEMFDRTQTVFAADASSEQCLFVQLSPMTSDPTKAARLVGQKNILSCAVVYDFIPLDVSERYLASAAAANEYAAQLGWLATFDRYFPISQYSARRLSEVLPVEASAINVTGVALRPAFERALAERHHAPQPIAGLPEKFVLFVGGGDPRKNLDVLLTAHSQLAASHSEVHLIVVGNYPPEHVNAIRELYRSQGGDAWKLHFRHGVDDDQLAQLYRLATCTVCSSHIEGFSLPVIEAVACGSPLLASNNDAHQELIDDERALFSATDAAALTACLRRVLDEPGFAEQLKIAQHEMPARFSAEAVCDRFWLPIAREMRQRSARPGSTISAAKRQERPRLAILSPYPPERSGVADYTRRTVEALGRIADVDVFTDCPNPVPTPEVRNFFPISNWPFISGEYDNTLTVVGNSHFHIKIVELQMEHGGPCLIHDNRLADFYNHWKGPEYLRQFAERSVGRPVSHAEAQLWLSHPGHLESLFFDELLPTASPLIVHSRGIQAQSLKQYGHEPTYLPFCCYRNFKDADLQPAARRKARAELGISPAQVVIISLGFVAPVKSPDTCIQAIAQMQQAGINAHLYFVGSAAGCRAELEAFAHNCGAGGMIHFSSEWLSDADYYRYLQAADFAIQLRTHFFGGLSGALMDCIGAGITTVANDDLAEAMASPPTVLRVPDNPSPEPIADHLLRAYRQKAHLERLRPSRTKYLRDHSFAVYAEQLVSLLTTGTACAPLEVQAIAANDIAPQEQELANDPDPSNMPSSPEPLPAQTSALDQRMQVMAAALGIDSSGLDSCVRFVERLKDLGVNREQGTFLLYQLFVARLPTPHEVLHLARHFDSDSPESLCRRYLESPEYKESRQAHIHFVTLPETGLAIDVTHTLNYPFNSGIQRVVRSLATQLESENLDHVLIKFDQPFFAYRLVEGHTAQSLYHWDRRTTHSPASHPSGSPAQPKSESKLKKFSRNLLGRALSERLRSQARVWKHRLRKKPAAPTPAPSCQTGTPPRIEHVLFLWNRQVLFPELMPDSERLSVVSSLLQFAPIESSLVVYDLMPLKHPDLSEGNVDGHIRYLTLLRHAKRVSCISRAVQEDLLQYLSLLDQNAEGPEVQTHLLGGDFTFQSVDNSSQHQLDRAVPLVLSVGTLEFRKNHRRTLRAMVEAQRQGCRFKGVFAGTPGWLGREFIQEVAQYRDEGFDVEVHESITDAALNTLYTNAAFTMFCSLAEGFGLPIVESIAKGIPCITSDRGSMREIAEKIGGCQLVDPESEAGIAQAIKNLLEDRQAYDRLRAEARRAKWTTWREYTHELYSFATASAAAPESRTLQFA
jgi:glycosyltransferase involved in cell wall biosynthesis